MIQVPGSIPDSHEILVHIAAASTAQDDARYRAQVAAILDFQCVSRQPLIEESNSSAPTNADQMYPFSGAVHSSVLSMIQQASPILREAPRPAHATLSSDDRLLSEKNDPAPRKHIISNYPDSLESLISVIPDSQPGIADELVHAERSRAELSPPSQLAPLSKRRRTAPPEPNSARPVFIAGSPAMDQPAASQKATIENQDHVPTGFPQTPMEITSADPGKGPNGTITHPANASHRIPANTPNHINLSTLPLEIHPPRPPISTASFTTHITPTLSMLTERLKPARTYKPSTQTRSLDPLERGYWHVHLAIENPPTRDRDLADLLPNLDTNPKSGTTDPIQTPKSPPREDTRTWPSPLFYAFWSFLSDFVGKDGRAGWGVWCILEATPAPSKHSPDTHVSLKVYAWGEIAMHVYLLLFLASERRIRGMGVQWRDSREEVVIQMP
ncbi:acetamidase [Penicillium digitatum]|uniref:Acetamidase n=3 Tax=Penicillium digitatum TaxID=36651 RepID=K9GFM3_PEND2|nr:hypothetical protein PDIP_02980 [Penicillium digitatum Pd1]EKV19799.1 hypothetical protein PDIG_00720 [Penicillium digitatum PHI26]EKV21821.1 hypothetical protein PDIP_02980 [Penicillium digitatum Pd1]KAG0154628.1 hypothetical protein PDIDSM_196 [Penicillium digitatum]QQK47622.1 acetamidase [Penicillium digitatum]